MDRANFLKSLVALPFAGLILKDVKAESESIPPPAQARKNTSGSFTCKKVTLRSGKFLAGYGSASPKKLICAFEEGACFSVINQGVGGPGRAFRRASFRFNMIGNFIIDPDVKNLVVHGKMLETNDSLIIKFFDVNRIWAARRTPASRNGLVLESEWDSSEPIPYNVLFPIGSED